MWEQIIQRCTNPKNAKFSIYGGRGICVCKRWRLSFKKFFSDVGLRPSDEYTIERKDSNGHYQPGNVRWATFAEQNRNLRTNRILVFRGKAWTIRDLARAHDMAPCTLHRRLKGGWSLRDAVLTKPKRVGRRVWASKQPPSYVPIVEERPRTRRTRVKKK